VTPIIAAALAQWPPLIGALVICGSSGVVMLQQRANASLLPTATFERIRRLWIVLASVTAISAPFAMLYDVSRMAGTGLAAAIPLLGEAACLTHAGRTWVWRVGIAGITLAVTLIAPANRSAKPAALFGLTLAMILAGGLDSHAVDHGSAAVAMCIGHLLGTAIWIGALITLILAYDQAGLRSFASNISRIAGRAVAVIVATGLYLGWLALGLVPDSLVYTAYGRTLVVKLGIFLIILVTAGYNRYRLLPGLDNLKTQRELIRNVGIEFALMLAVIFVATMLANTPPPH
jgi:putative copper export protein